MATNSVSNSGAPTMVFPWKNVNSRQPGQLWDTRPPADRTRDVQNPGLGSAYMGDIMMGGANYIDAHAEWMFSKRTLLDINVIVPKENSDVDMYDAYGRASTSKITPNIFGISLGGSIPIPGLSPLLTELRKENNLLGDVFGHLGISYSSESFGQYYNQTPAFSVSLGFSAHGFLKPYIGENSMLAITVADIAAEPMTTFKVEAAVNPANNQFVPTIRGGGIFGLNNSAAYGHVNFDWNIRFVPDKFEMPIGLGYDSVGGVNFFLGMKIIKNISVQANLFIPTGANVSSDVFGLPFTFGASYTF